MLTIRTNRNCLHVFLSLTGNAFDSRNVFDANRSHGFYWAMRWLARQVIGANWMLWVSQVGGE